VRVRIDPDKCVGHAMCVESAPDVFDLDPANDRAYLLVVSPPETQRAAVNAAILGCPQQAISAET
jgi:ferredoxin